MTWLIIASSCGPPSSLQSSLPPHFTRGHERCFRIVQATGRPIDGRHLGVILGAAYGGGGLGGFIGPFLGGWLFDVTGSYHIAFAAPRGGRLT